MSTSVSERVQMHRACLRPVQIWVPDTRRASFADECRRQSYLLRSSASRSVPPATFSLLRDKFLSPYQRIEVG